MPPEKDMPPEKGKDKWEDVKEPLGCLLWIVVFFLLYLALSIGDDLVAYLESAL